MSSSSEVRHEASPGPTSGAAPASSTAPGAPAVHTASAEPAAPAAPTATEQLWALRAPGTPAVAFAAAVTGQGVDLLADAAAISLATSPEAGRLLDGMDARIRTINTTVELHEERCVYSVRGPVQWAETMTARANSLGSEDVFVCSAARRSFDTIENRVLVAALEAVARADRALQGPVADRVSAEQAAAVAERSARAAGWLRHPHLQGVRATRLTGRDAVRLRTGHRSSRMQPVLAVRDRALEPLDGSAVAALCDPPTLAYHRFWSALLDVFVAAGAVERTLCLAQGSVRSGQLVFQHPLSSEADGRGITYRGVALLPPAVLRARLPWRDRLPARGIEIASVRDVEQLLGRLAERERRRSARTQASGSSSTTSSSSS